MTDQTPAHQPDEGGRNEARKVTPTKIIGAIIVLTLVGAFFLGDSPPDRGTEAKAYDACQQAVEDRLRAPSTAEYPPRGEAEIRNTGERWVVEAWVDAQNAAGVPLRNRFFCTVTYEGNDSWKLDRLELVE